MNSPDEKIELTSYSDNDFGMYKEEINKIFMWDFVKVFGSNIVEDIMLYIELMFDQSKEMHDQHWTPDTWDFSPNVGDIHDATILFSGIGENIIQSMESAISHKIIHNLNSYIKPDGSVQWKDRIFRIVLLLGEIDTKMNEIFPLVISNIVSGFISNYLLNLYKKGNEKQKKILQQMYAGFPTELFMSETVNIYDALFDKLNIEREENNYDKDRLEYIFYSKILTKDFEKDSQEYSIILHSWDKLFQHIVNWKIFFKQSNIQIDFKIILWTLELYLLNDVKLSFVLNKKDYSVLKNDVLMFFLESLEKSDIPSDSMLAHNKNTLTEKVVTVLQEYTQGNTDNILLGRQNDTDNSLLDHERNTNNNYEKTLSRVKSKTSKEIINAFNKLTTLMRVRWSHHMFQNKETSSTFPVPLSNWCIPIWTLHSIIKLSWFSIFEINEKL